MLDKLNDPVHGRRNRGVALALMALIVVGLAVIWWIVQHDLGGAFIAIIALVGLSPFFYGVLWPRPRSGADRAGDPEPRQE